MASLTQLQYAVAVDRHRNFGRAARACFVSQPTLSMQLQKLEEELGVPLFDRTKQPIIPTKKGREILDMAKRIIQDVEALEYIGKREPSEPRGEYRLGVIPTLAPYLLPLFLKRFSDQFPKVELFVDEMKTQEIVDALNEDQIDAGLVVTPLDQKNIKKRILFYEEFYLYVRPENPIAKQKLIREKELELSQIWLLEEGHCFRNQVLNVCSDRTKDCVLHNIHFESGNLETLKEMVQQGMGYTLLPYLSIWQETDPLKKRMTKRFSNPIPNREVSLVFQREHLKTDILDALHQCIDQCVPKELPRTPTKEMSVVKI